MKTLAHISDLHFGTETPALAAGLRRDLHEFAPAVLVVSGDLTQRARRGQFLAAKAFLATLPAPQLIVPGNHDVPLFNLYSRFLRSLTHYRRIIADELDPVYDDGELFVAGINTARSLTWKAGRISVEQLEALQVALAATRAKFKVVVTHHPFIPPPIDGAQQAHIDLVGRAARAMKMLDASGVDLLLAGHLHHGYSGDTRTQYPAARRAIISAQAGTAISRRVRSDPNGYNRITLDRDRIVIEVRTWKQGEFVKLRTTEYWQTGNGWAEAEA
jgi:3',5'-cyclic AMP phosphodiesterase CpdA